MLIFLYGIDTYRSKQKLREIVKGHRKIHKSGLSLIVLDIKEKSFHDFDNQIRSISMFQEKKLIILKNAFLDSDFKEKFLKKKEDYKKTKDIIIFFEEQAPLKNDPLFKFLKEYGKSQVFEFLSGYELKNWAKKEFENYGGEIEPSALEKLVDFIGNDLWQFSNEIKKLSFFAKGRKVIQEDVELLVRSKVETDIFKTIDALAERNKKKALFLTHKHLEKGDSPFYLLTMINYQFRNLLIIKSQGKKYIAQSEISSLSKKLGLHPFVVRKSSWHIKRFTIEELKKIYQKIFQADYNIKAGRIKPEIALDMLIADI